MTGPVSTFEDVADGADVDDRRRSRRIDLLDGGQEREVDAGCLEHRKVCGFVARVALEVLALSELGRIDEDARDHRRTLRARCSQQAFVAAMERAHRGYETDRSHQLGARGAERLTVADGLHGATGRAGRLEIAVERDRCRLRVGRHVEGCLAQHTREHVVVHPDALLGTGKCSRCDVGRV